MMVSTNSRQLMSGVSGGKLMCETQAENPRPRRRAPRLHVKLNKQKRNKKK